MRGTTPADAFSSTGHPDKIVPYLLTTQCFVIVRAHRALKALQHLADPGSALRREGVVVLADLHHEGVRTSPHLPHLRALGMDAAGDGVLKGRECSRHRLGEIIHGYLLLGDL